MPTSEQVAFTQAWKRAAHHFRLFPRSGGESDVDLLRNRFNAQPVDGRTDIVYQRALTSEERSRFAMLPSMFPELPRSQCETGLCVHVVTPFGEFACMTGLPSDAVNNPVLRDRYMRLPALKVLQSVAIAAYKATVAN